VVSIAGAMTNSGGRLWLIGRKQREFGEWLRGIERMQRWTRVSPRVPLIFYRARRALIHRHSDDGGRDAMEKMSLLWARILAPNLPVGVRGWEQLAGCQRASAVVANGGRRRGFGVVLSPMRGGRKTKTVFPAAAIKRSGTLCWALAWLVAGHAGGLWSM
jgi:hypothetical protein